MTGAGAGYSWGMFPVENLRDWAGLDVIDPESKKIGTLEAVYVDTLSDEPAFVTVQFGLVTRHLAFVPVGGATVTPKAVRVRYGKDLVRDAPQIPVDGELAAADEPKLFAHYHLDYGERPERRLARR
ncbi:PRC-barrel domain-containing protein [Actinokineospora globicatena]|uniref:Photosystem reaction center subunit H n=1 Tax=Actinokineospora globicatena TaxID=103729 RepID=A0A9W6V6J3_9PSEU|nr:PRC-barrel domain-containing protein [Actinokineospora globicatena]MCP2303074.1 PRC-barrel domain-containing protein [Actinokineospora globicatena]GLW79813.1 photosystem reaction center subunit H [Actinokineospora globicatena]GLW85777.1 photosystem reaction center subunit H [Actinokineospora globicatena]GLW90437.1 photosystem reaction center subunit H [Actinokineospora globicatena]